MARRRTEGEAEGALPCRFPLASGQVSRVSPRIASEEEKGGEGAVRCVPPPSPLVSSLLHARTLSCSSLPYPGCATSLSSCLSGLTPPARIRKGGRGRNHITAAAGFTGAIPAPARRRNCEIKRRDGIHQGGTDPMQMLSSSSSLRNPLRNVERGLGRKIQRGQTVTRVWKQHATADARLGRSGGMHAHRRDMPDGRTDRQERALCSFPRVASLAPRGRSRVPCSFERKRLMFV